MRYQSTDWTLDLPEGWDVGSDEDCTTFAHPDGSGAFQVSSHRSAELVTDDDLRDFAGDIPLHAVALGRLTGFRLVFSDHDVFWMMWWLRAGRQMIYLTYNCPLPERGREDAALDAMIASLTPTYGLDAS